MNRPYDGPWVRLGCSVRAVLHVVAMTVGIWVGFAPQPSTAAVLPPGEEEQTLLLLHSAETLKALSVSQGVKVAPGAQGFGIVGNVSRASVTVRSGAPGWNLAGFLYLACDVHNAGNETVTLVCRVEDPDYAGWHHFSESVARLKPGQTTSALAFLKRKNGPDPALQARFPGMHALPNGYMPIWSGLNPDRISRVILSFEAPTPNLSLELRGVRATGRLDSTAIAKADFFPFVDAFGQFRHADWPSKIHRPEDFAAQRRAEATSLEKQPRPSVWDQYGGFASGPQLPATGHFRVAKHEGKWWLVDPEGRLFWSHGVTGVGGAGSTKVAGREHFFSALPPAEAAGPRSANFHRANLIRKYGENPEPVVAALAHQRLASWGLNTLGSWAETEVVERRKTPYTKTLHIAGPGLAPGLKLPDPFHPVFEANARKAFESERNASGNDPWCVGYFIANELEWRSGPEIVNEVLTAAPIQPGKQAFLRVLQSRYGTIDALNVAWKTSYASWNNLAASTNRVDPVLARDDFAAFNRQLAERYYGTCQAELKRATPRKLNLGSRFHTLNPVAVSVAARFCDVLSFNKYATSIRHFALPEGLDRPVIIGEFHFPAFDRSYTAHAGRSPLSLEQRADAYWYYVTGALENPLIVGAHWFQYLDQPITGRADGENWAIGFVDVADAPYAELTRVTRELGQEMYARRLGIPLPPKPTAPTAAHADAGEL